MTDPELQAIERLFRGFFAPDSDVPFVMTQDSADLMAAVVIRLLAGLPPEKHLAALNHLADNARRVRIELVDQALRDGHSVTLRDGREAALLTESSAGTVSAMESLRTSGY